MATPTDLDGFLRVDDDNLTIRLSNWWASLPVGTVCAVNVRYKSTGAVSMERLHPDPLVVESDIKGVDNLIEAVSKIITDKLGDRPHGHIRVVINAKGKSKHPEVDMQRTLIVPEVASEPNLALVRGMLDQERRYSQKVIELLIASHASTTAMAGQLADALMNAATVRAATSSSADLGSGGLGTILGLAILVLGAPHLKEALGLQKDATLVETIKAVRMFVSTSASRFEQLAAQDGGVVQVPPGAVEPKQLEDGAEDGNGSELATLLDRLREDPDLKKEMALELGRRPELVAELSPLIRALDAG